MRARTPHLGMLVVTTLLTLGLAPVASAGEPHPIPPDCGLDCPDPVYYDHEATLSVSRTAGTVTSDTQNGHAISCGATCSVTDSQTTEDPTFPVDGWFTYTLSASGGPSGYSPFWTGCDAGSHVGGTCSVTNDSAGGTSVDVSWADTTAPNVTFAPPAKVGPNGYSVTAGATDNSGAVAAYQWTVDNVAQGATGSTLNLSGFAEGGHTVAVRARDGAGNYSSTVSKTVTVDKSVTLAVEPLEPYVDQPPVVSFVTAQDVVSRSCWVGLADEAPVWSPCTSPWQVPGPLADGSYEVAVTVTDDVGNSSTVVQDVVVDSASPVVTFQDGPADGSTQQASTALFSFTATDGSPVEVTCTLDGEPRECASATPVELSELAPGAHTFTVTAVDAAGNTTEVSRSFTRRIPTSLTAKAKDRTVERGKAVRLVATGLPMAATGKVVFTRKGHRLCSAVVEDGVARCRTGTGLKPGRYDAKAAYKGAVGYQRSSDTFWFKIVR